MFGGRGRASSRGIKYWKLRMFALRVFYLKGNENEVAKSS